MNPQVFMIKVKYNHAKTVKSKKLPVQSIHIGQELSANESGNWIIPTHFRYTKQDYIRQIGIRLPSSYLDYEILFSPPNQNFSVSLTYSKKYDIWYEDTLFSYTKKRGYFKFDESSLLTGMTSPGSVVLLKKSLKTSEISSLGAVHFVPSSLSAEDYNVMLTELYVIHEDFIKDHRNTARAGILSIDSYINLNERINTLSIALNQINSNPHKELKLITSRKASNKLENKRFDLATEWEKYLSPGQSAYKVKNLTPVTQTYENQMIKQVLEQLNHHLSFGTHHPLFQKYIVKRLVNEQNILLSNSDYSLSLSRLEKQKGENYTHLKNVKDQLAKSVQQFQDIENSVYKKVFQSADFNSTPPVLENPNLYVDVQVNLRLNGSLLDLHNYSHYYNKSGIHFSLNYDNHTPAARRVLEVNNYQLGNAPITKPNSHFGKIHLDSMHVLSHFLLHTLFNEHAVKLKTPAHIKIFGKVKDLNKGLDAVSSPNPNSSSYNSYSFNFVEITYVSINGKKLIVDSSQENLHAFINKKLVMNIDNLETYETDLINFKQLERVTSLEDEIQQFWRLSLQYKQLKEKITTLLKLPLFQNISTDIKLPVYPTPLFLHNPSYGLAWKAIHGIENETSVFLLASESNKQIGTIKSEKLFETWSLFKMIHLLSGEMGWSLSDRSSIQLFLKTYFKSNGKLQNFTATLTKDSWKLKIFYEPVIDVHPESYLTPDYVFQFSYDNTPLGISILDAKYRNYDAQGIEMWVKDINEVAIEKYGQMIPKHQNWRHRILSSSILHSNIDFSKNNTVLCHPYHVLYNKELFKQELSLKNAHRFTSISMTPSDLMHFKNWFRLQMEFHLNDYRSCWYCGESSNIEEKQLSTKGGFPKFYYSCKNCNEFWVKVHCQANKHKLIKHLDNYHLQFRKANTSKWYVVCPSCGDGRPDQVLIEDDLPF